MNRKLSTMAACLPELPREERQRAGLLAGAAVAALLLGFFIFDAATSALLVRKLGYPLMLAAWILFLGCLVRLVRDRTCGAPRPEWRTILWALGWIGLGSWLVLSAEPFGFKVLFDEFTLQATALHLHLEHQVATVTRGYEIEGSFVALESFLDKRPFFFPFLVALLHDLTGYRPENAFYLNAALVPILLGLVWHLAGRLGNPTARPLAILLLASLPLLGQNATGSGMEMLNLTLLALLICLGAAYLDRPDARSLSALVLGAVLLAQTRYESAIYVACTAWVIWEGWRRGGRVVLSGPAVAAPLLLLPYAWQNRMLSQTPSLWEIPPGTTSRFGVEHLAANVESALRFFFHVGGDLAGSWYLALIGGASLLYLGYGAIRWGRPVSAAARSAAIFGAGMIASLLLLLAYYWGQLEEPVVARLSLPFWLLLALAVVAGCRKADGRFRATRTALIGAALFLVGYALPTMSRHVYSAGNLAAQEIAWEKEMLSARGRAELLVLSNKSTLPWMLEKTPALLLDRVPSREAEIRHHFAAGTFREILVCQALDPTTAEGDFEVRPNERLPQHFVLEPVHERTFGARRARISRLVDMGRPEVAEAGVETGLRGRHAGGR